MLSSSKVLEFHVKNCLVIYHTKSVLLPEENEYVNFQNWKRLIKTPSIIYGDFECVLMPLTDNIDFGPNTKKYKDHIVCSYSYKLVCVDDQYSKLDRSYFGEDAIDKFLNDMIKESKYCSRVIETKFNKTLAMTKKIMKIQ